MQVTANRQRGRYKTIGMKLYTIQTATSWLTQQVHAHVCGQSLWRCSSGGRVAVCTHELLPTLQQSCGAVCPARPRYKSRTAFAPTAYNPQQLSEPLCARLSSDIRHEVLIVCYHLHEKRHLSEKRCGAPPKLGVPACPLTLTHVPCRYFWLHRATVWHR